MELFRAFCEKSFCFFLYNLGFLSLNLVLKRKGKLYFIKCIINLMLQHLTTH